MRNVRLNLSEAANLVIDECEIFWRKARIPTKGKSDSVKKLKKLYEEWRNLEKSCKRRTDNQQGKEKAFSEKLNNLFDIAHANALNIMSIEKDKQFLIAQRKPNRVGSMLGIDNKITAAEKRKAVTEKKKELKKQKLQAEKEKNQTYVPTPRFSSSDSETSERGRVFGEAEPRLLNTCSDPTASWEEQNNLSLVPDNRKLRRARNLILTGRLAAALDKCHVSDRDAVHILNACVESLSLDPMDFVINRSSIRRARHKYRKDIAKDIERNFSGLNVDFAIVHWDTKLLPDLTNTSKVDRLPVIVKTHVIEQLLGVPHIPSYTKSPAQFMTH